MFSPRRQFGGGFHGLLSILITDININLNININIQNDILEFYHYVSLSSYCYILMLVNEY